MSKIKQYLKSEFVSGKKPFDYAFLAFGLLLQLFAVLYGYAIGSPDNAASIISAFTGIVSVVLCAQGKISFYLFGYIQLLTYTFGVAIPNHLYGEIWENVFYFVTMIYGTFVWAKRYTGNAKSGETKINPKFLTKRGNIIMYAVMIVGTVLMTIVLSHTNDPVPFFDAITTVPAFTAQILLMFGYREQWVGWLIEDVSSIVMFAIIGNWVMVAQYIFWTINCIYGWVEWSKKDSHR